MIIINFMFDYLVMIFLPINTYFIINELDKNSLLNVFVIGFLFDIMYHKLFLFLMILLFLYFFLIKLNIKNKYYYIKNIFVFLFFIFIVFIFNKSFDFDMFLISFILQIIYMILYKKLLK